MGGKKKRDLPADDIGSKKISKQATLSFGNSADPPGTKWGKPKYDSFKELDNKVSIWSWNINGTNATIEKGKL